MKNLNYLILTALIICHSCSDESLSDPAPTIDNYGILSFTGPVQLRDYLKEVSAKNQNNKNLGPSSTKHGTFTSFEDVYNEALLEFSNCEDQANFDLLKRKYQDILLFNDTGMIPVIPLSSYMKICNRERIYKTGNMVNKVIDANFILSTNEENINELRKLNSIQNVDPKIFKIFEYSTNFTDVGSARTLTSCGSNFQVVYFYNRPNCRDDRRVRLTVFAQKTIYHDSFNGLL